MIYSDKYTLEPGQVAGFSKIVTDYLSQDPFLEDFIQFFPKLETIAQMIQVKKVSDKTREILVSIIKQQYQQFLSSDHPFYHKIQSLYDVNTFSVCAGHQLNIFGGPLYCLYKIASCINAARQISKCTGKNVLPVFWLASEDHDMEEIKFTEVFGKRYEWETDWKGASGKAECKGLEELIAQILSDVRPSEHSSKVFSLLKKCYQNGKSLSLATREFLHELFGSYGLILLDADDHSLKKMFLPVMLDDIQMHSAKETVNQSIEKLRSRYHIQMNPRTVNLFYMTTGSRERIIQDNESFRTTDSDRAWTLESLSSELKMHPERFSPNVTLRPLYQESVLPNIATVGGPAELAYWLELKHMFEKWSVSFPMFLLRNSFLLVDKIACSKLEKYHIYPEHIFDTSDAWIRSYVNEKFPSQIDLDNYKNGLKHTIDKLSNDVSKIDKSLVPSVQSVQVSLEKSIANLETKIFRALKKKQENDVEQLKSLREKLFPSDVLQERKEYLLQYLIMYGLGFVAEIVDHADPFPGKFTVLAESKLLRAKS